uniref:E3 ubiquitin-protein ligase makorin-2 n=1 Tax=Neogobius melanostomus TaxID=47308 RepID=A0A8C6SMC9_9GOBI
KTPPITPLTLVLPPEGLQKGFIKVNKYFLHGVCREGSNCHFSHDVHNSAPSLIYRCRYDHVKATPRGEEPQTLLSSAPCVLSPAIVRGGDAQRTQLLRSNLFGIFIKLLYLRCIEYVHVYMTVSCVCAATPDSAQLCPYLVMGQCHYGDQCMYLHGNRCDVCGLHLLHPTDAEQRREHEKLCLSEFEAEMEKAFAAQISQDKVCSICMEVVVQKISQSERRFGIMSSCDHCFCLGCIRKWRHAPFSNEVIKACPECRVPSELVIPSVHWVQEQTQKDQLVALFKNAVSKKPCKFFLEGRGTCPFGDRCLYLHQDPFGRKPEPERVRKQLTPEGAVRVRNTDHQKPVDRLTSWCSHNNLELNAQKTVEMIVDFRKDTAPPSPSPCQALPPPSPS